MEGPLLAEFSNLNALSHRGPSGTSLPQPRGPPPRGQLHASGSQTARSSRPLDDVAHKERLLRGEAAYTGMPGDLAADHLIDDNPQSIRYGVSSLVHEEATMEERERLLRRLEMCAKAREESTKIMSIRYAQRDAVKNDMRRDRQQFLEKISTTQHERDERWSRKLQRSPFAVDLVAENQRIDEEHRVQRTMETRRQRLLTQRNREAHEAIFKRATAETDELDQLRMEKRLMLETEKQLKALKDVEKSNARTAQILQNRRRRQLEKDPFQAVQLPEVPRSAR